MKKKQMWEIGPSLSKKLDIILIWLFGWGRET